jgi:hypothetical protein
MDNMIDELRITGFNAGCFILYHLKLIEHKNIIKTIFNAKTENLNKALELILNDVAERPMLFK